jgi:hypothetical protein
MVHRRRRIPIVLTALAVAAAASVPAAQAAPTRADVGAVKPAVLAKPSAVHLEVSPTGNGPADAEVCEAFETNISNQVGNFVDAVLDGDIGRAAGLVEAVNNLSDMATEAGCNVVW